MTVHTPIGQFATQVEAARALNCDRRTLLRRVKSDPDNYKITNQVRKSLPAWSEYRYMPFDDKEEIYQAWCKQQKLDPDLADTADAFFDAIDAVVPETQNTL